LKKGANQNQIDRRPTVFGTNYLLNNGNGGKIDRPFTKLAFYRGMGRKARTQGGENHALKGLFLRKGRNRMEGGRA